MTGPRLRSALRGAALAGTALIAVLAVTQPPGHASSHRDAPRLALCPTDDITDVYAFVGERDGERTLVAGMSFGPYLEDTVDAVRIPFDHTAVYELNIARLSDVAEGRSTLRYQFRFRPPETLRRRAYPSAESLRENPSQLYDVSVLDGTLRGRKKKKPQPLGTGIVAPWNGGPYTPLYNAGGDGLEPRADPPMGELDPYTAAAIQILDGSARSFAGPRDDAFYGDLRDLFDLENVFADLPDSTRAPADTQGGFNVQSIMLELPLDQLLDKIGADRQVGVWSRVMRPRTRTLLPDGRAPRDRGGLRQVARLGNPLLSRQFLAPERRDRFNAVGPAEFLTPEVDAELDAELELLQRRVLPTPSSGPNPLRAIYIPDVLRVNVTTGPARHPGQSGFSRLSALGTDVFLNDGEIPGGWPNGRRPGDDVVDIALGLLAAGGVPLPGARLSDGIDANDVTLPTVFPYLAAPHNSLRHRHHGEPAEPGGGTGGGGGSDPGECIEIVGAGNVPAVTQSFAFLVGEQPVQTLVAGQTYTIASSVLLETAVEPGPLTDVRVELRLGGVTVIDETFEELARFGFPARVAYTAPEDTDGQLCAQLFVNGELDVQFLVTITP